MFTETYIRWHMVSMVLEQYLIMFCLPWLHCYLETAYSSGIYIVVLLLNCNKESMPKYFSVVKNEFGVDA